MKVRNDFVTNSSSSNFTISLTAYDDEGMMCTIAMRKHDFTDSGDLTCDFGRWYYMNDDITVKLDGKVIDIGKQVEEIQNEMRDVEHLEGSIFAGRLFDICRAVARKNTASLSFDDKLIALAMVQCMEEIELNPSKIEKIEIERDFQVVEIDDETAPLCEDFFPNWDEVLLEEEDDEVYAERYGTDVKSIVAFRAMMDSSDDFAGPMRETWTYDVKTDTMKKEYYMRPSFLDD